MMIQLSRLGWLSARVRAPLLRRTWVKAATLAGSRTRTWKKKRCPHSLAAPRCQWGNHQKGTPNQKKKMNCVRDELRVCKNAETKLKHKTDIDNKWLDWTARLRVQTTWGFWLKTNGWVWVRNRGKAFPSESECAKRMAKRNNFVEDQQQDWDESIKTFCLRVC